MKIKETAVHKKKINKINNSVRKILDTNYSILSTKEIKMNLNKLSESKDKQSNYELSASVETEKTDKNTAMNNLKLDSSQLNNT